MDRSEWVGRLELLHSSARAGVALSPQDAEWYMSARRQLFQTAVGVQNAYLAGNENYRKAIRLERAVPVLLEQEGWTVTASTADLGPGGFSVLTMANPPVGERGRATVELPQAKVVEEVRVVAVSRVGTSQRVSMAFTAPSDATVALFEDLVLDTLLPRLVFWDQVLDRLSL